MCTELMQYFVLIVECLNASINFCSNFGLYSDHYYLYDVINNPS